MRSHLTRCTCCTCCTCRRRCCCCWRGNGGPQGQGKLDPNPYKLAKEKGIFSILDGIKGALTNELLVERIISNRDQYVNRNKTREKKELDYLQKDKTFIAERVGTAADGGAAAASRA